MNWNDGLLAVAGLLFLVGGWGASWQAGLIVTAISCLVAWVLIDLEQQ
jgi:hypothetical protein